MARKPITQSRWKNALESIIEEIVTFYGQYGDEAEGQINALLADFEAVDPKAYTQWAAIVDLWKEEPAVNEGILPDDLPETDELCLVALGFQLNPDGAMREELIERLKVVLACGQKYPHALIVCTGGTAADTPNATEAGMMARQPLTSITAPTTSMSCQRWMLIRQQPQRICRSNG